MRGHEIKDDDWIRIQNLLPGQPGELGVTAEDYPLYVNAVLGIAKTGALWRDLPEQFGPWGSGLEAVRPVGREADVTRAEPLIQGNKADAYILDQAYDSDAVVGAAKRQNAEAVIPSEKNRKIPRDHDKHLYKERKKFEWFINLIKRYGGSRHGTSRRTATSLDLFMWR
jgi:transposase